MGSSDIQLDASRCSLRNKSWMPAVGRMVPEILEFEVLTLDCVGGSMRGRRGTEGLQIDEAACGLSFHSWMLTVRCVVAEIFQFKVLTLDCGDQCIEVA